MGSNHIFRQINIGSAKRKYKEHFAKTDEKSTKEILKTTVLKNRNVLLKKTKTFFKKSLG